MMITRKAVADQLEAHLTARMSLEEHPPGLGLERRGREERSRSAGMESNERKPWLSKWKVLGPVGDGGQGRAELCVPLASTDESQLYVLKRLKRQMDPERRKRMHREVSALRTLSHVGLPSYVDGNTDQFEAAARPLYFVMEYVRGSTLESAVRRQPLSLAAALDLTIALVDIVDYCHSNDVIHRDIKPDNIVLRNNAVARPVLIDFGQTFNRDESAA